MTAFVVPSASEACAVIWAEAPLAAFSGTSLASRSASEGVETSASSSSIMLTVNVVLAVEESALVALMVNSQLSDVS